MHKIAVIGMGYVGIPVAVLLATAGHDVTGIQRLSKRSGWKIDWLNEGRCPIEGHEPELPGLLKRAVKDERFRATSDFSVLKDIDIILIDVQTPTDENHVPQYESLKEVCYQIGKFLQPGKAVIIESTVSPGTTDHMVKPILEEVSGIKAGLPGGFGLCFSYERVMLGRLIHNIREYPKIVGGIDEESTRLAMGLYRSIVRGGVYGTTPMTAEVSKTVENAYRDVQIAFANEVALLCESLGIDVYDVRKFVNGLPNDPSIPHANPVRTMHFPGAGVGGHCLPKDTWLLMHGYHENLKLKNLSPVFNRDPELTSEHETQKFPFPVSILEGARYLNDWMPVHMVDLLESGLREARKEIKGARVCVLGYAFLENSADPRNTPTVALIEELAKRGAEYRVHDPYISEDGNYCIEQNLDCALHNCDALVLMTKHDEYKSLNPKRLRNLLRTMVVVDGRNLFDPEKFTAEGFIFRGVGKGNVNKSYS